MIHLSTLLRTTAVPCLTRLNEIFDFSGSRVSFFCVLVSHGLYRLSIFLGYFWWYVWNSRVININSTLKRISVVISHVGYLCTFRSYSKILIILKCKKIVSQEFLIENIFSTRIGFSTSCKLHCACVYILVWQLFQTNYFVKEIVN